MAPLPTPPHRRQIQWLPADEMSEECRDLIDRLLTLDPKARLGHRGAGEVKLHPWFNGVGWASLARSKAAFIPSLDCETDTSYFSSKQASQRYAAGLRRAWRSGGAGRGRVWRAAGLQFLCRAS